MRNKLKILIAVFALMAANICVANAESYNGIEVHSYSSSKGKYQKIQFDGLRVIQDVEGFMADNGYELGKDQQIRIYPMPQTHKIIGDKVEELKDENYKGLAIFYKPFKRSLIRTFPKDRSSRHVKLVLSSRAVEIKEKTGANASLMLCDFTDAVKLILRKLIARRNGERYTGHILDVRSLEVTPKQGRDVERSFKAQVETKPQPIEIKALIFNQGSQVGEVPLCEQPAGLLSDGCRKGKIEYTAKKQLNLAPGDYSVKVEATWKHIESGFVEQFMRMISGRGPRTKTVTKTTRDYQASFTLSEWEYDSADH